jgi:hypothetical protein
MAHLHEEALLPAWLYALLVVVVFPLQNHFRIASIGQLIQRASRLFQAVNSVSLLHCLACLNSNKTMVKVQGPLGLRKHL